jgi:hypothetical protein
VLIIWLLLVRARAEAGLAVAVAEQVDLEPVQEQVVAVQRLKVQ